VRQFLLKNLKRNASGDGYSFRVPIETLGDSLEKLGQFDFVPGQDRYDGKALFIRGGRSGYIKEREMGLINDFFPHARVETLDTGHWGKHRQGWPRRNISVLQGNEDSHDYSRIFFLLT
jgi:hypothetical protein